MFDSKKLEQAMGVLGTLTEEQKALVAKAADAATEQEFLEKLKGLGIELDEATFGKFLGVAAQQAETEVFDQEVAPDELEAVAGGLFEPENCTNQNRRNIYHPSFPNCAATVEDGSWCGGNDACYSFQVLYEGMSDCSKAWK